jgi:hypothetical protein
VTHFYHVFANGAWKQPVAEHVDALLAAGFEGNVHIGLVGTPERRKAARLALRRLPRATVAVEADEGWEQVTLAAVKTYAAERDGAVLYAHTKGAHDNTEFRAAWRRSMCRRVVERWRENLAALDEYDAAGCHWLTPEQFPNSSEFKDGIPFFGGNFWIARCDYLRTLPDPPTETRFQAERWIGMGSPRVFDLLPGWPAEELFA